MWKSKINSKCQAFPQSKQSSEIKIFFQSGFAQPWLSKVQFDVDPSLLLLSNLYKKRQEQKVCGVIVQGEEQMGLPSGWVCPLTALDYILQVNQIYSDAE